MLDKISKFTFLIDVTDDYDFKAIKMFKDLYKVYEVEHKPEISFKISADWAGNWMAGSWYLNSEKIEDPFALFEYLPKADSVILAYHLDILEEISTWGKEKYIKFGVLTK